MDTSKTNNRPRHVTVFVGVLGSLLVLSWLSSAYGLYEVFLLTVGASALYMHLLGGGVALIFSGLIQSLVGAFWHFTFSRDAGILLRGFSVIGGLAFSGVSGALAAAFWLFLFGASDYEALLNDRKYAVVAEPLAAFANDQDSIAFGFSSLSEQMRAEATIEAERGASCDGRPVRVGEGPRFRLRQRLNSESAQHAVAVASVASDARKAIRLPKEVDDAAMQAAWERAGEVGRSTSITDAVSWIDDVSRGFVDQHTDPKTGNTFVCRDQAVLTALTNLKSQLENRMVLPAVPPRAEKVDRIDSLGNSFHQLWSLVGPVLGFEVARDLEALERTRPGFVLAIAVELAIIFLMAFLALLRNPRAKPRLPKGNPPTDAERHELAAVVSVFDDFVMQVGGKYYLFQPEDGDPGLRQFVHVEALRWKLKQTKIGQAVPLDKITDEGPNFFVHRVLSKRSGGATHFVIYEMNHKALDFWQQAVIDLRNAPAGPSTATA